MNLPAFWIRLDAFARELADGHEDRDDQTADAGFGLVEGADTL